MAESRPISDWIAEMKLPNAPSLDECEGIAADSTLGAAYAASTFANGITAKRYYKGVFQALAEHVPLVGQFKAYYNGYSAAKAWMGAKSLQPTTHSVWITGPFGSDNRILEISEGADNSVANFSIWEREQSAKNVVGDDAEKRYVVAYAVVHPDELAELRYKAGCWDSLQSLIEQKKQEAESDRLSVDAAKRLTELKK